MTQVHRKTSARYTDDSICLLAKILFVLLPPFLITITAPTLPSTLSLHDALPIFFDLERRRARRFHGAPERVERADRSEEHTSELQSRFDLVCRLLLEKKKSPERSHQE